MDVETDVSKAAHPALKNDEKRVYFPLVSSSRLSRDFAEHCCLIQPNYREVIQPVHRKTEGWHGGLGTECWNNFLLSF